MITCTNPHADSNLKIIGGVMCVMIVEMMIARAACAAAAVAAACCSSMADAAIVGHQEEGMFDG